MPQWRGFSVVVTLSHNPLGEKLLFQFKVDIFAHKAASQNTSWLFLASVASEAKRRLISEALRGELPVKERALSLWAFALFLWNVRKSPTRIWAYSKECFYLSLPLACQAWLSSITMKCCYARRRPAPGLLKLGGLIEQGAHSMTRSINRPNVQEKKF